VPGFNNGGGVPTGGRDDGPDAVPGWALLVLAAFLVLLSGALLRSADDAFAPRPGDVLLAPRGDATTSGSPVRVLAHRLPGGVGAWLPPADPDAGSGLPLCVLSPAAMAASGGGSLVVRAHDRMGRLYAVGWAGSRTARDPGEDCGPSAALAVSREGMRALARALPRARPPVSVARRPGSAPLGGFP